MNLQTSRRESSLRRIRKQQVAGSNPAIGSTFSFSLPSQTASHSDGEKRFSVLLITLGSDHSTVVLLG
jgi:hypothetical protein